MKKYIAQNPKILGGTPVLAGTRVPVARVIFLLKEGYTVDAIHDEFPHISTKIIEGAVTELIDELGSTTYAQKVL